MPPPLADDVSTVTPEDADSGGVGSNSSVTIVFRRFDVESSGGFTVRCDPDATTVEQLRGKLMASPTYNFAGAVGKTPEVVVCLFTETCRDHAGPRSYDAWNQARGLAAPLASFGMQAGQTHTVYWLKRVVPSRSSSVSESTSPPLGTTTATAASPVPAVRPCTLYSKGMVGIFECSGSCGQSGPVWGTHPNYTADSVSCIAAKHAGVIPATGGRYRVQTFPGLRAYEASTARGIITRSWGNYDLTMRISPV